MRDGRRHPRRHPEGSKDLKPAKQFLNYYLDAAMKIVTRYAELATGPAGSPEVMQSLAKAESVMDTLNESFEKQQAKLKENDVLDLDTEIQVFEKMNEREL
jgi:5-bromo-4-chloroindolyl phosphate hydrolysis protein